MNTKLAMKIDAELLLVRLRDHEKRAHDDLEALRTEIDRFKSLDTPYGHNIPSV